MQLYKLKSSGLNNNTITKTIKSVQKYHSCINNNSMTAILNLNTQNPMFLLKPSMKSDLNIYGKEEGQ